MLVYDRKREERNEYPWVCPVIACNEIIEQELGGKWSDQSITVQRQMHRAESDKRILTERTESLLHRVDRLWQSLNSSHPSVSSLGDIQGSQDVDVACAHFERSASDLSKWLEDTYPDRFGQPKQEFVPPVKRKGGRRRR